ncbi:unnamed protein product, partial [Ixodes pacificus]
LQNLKSGRWPLKWKNALLGGGDARGNLGAREPTRVQTGFLGTRFESLCRVNTGSRTTGNTIGIRPGSWPNQRKTKSLHPTILAVNSCPHQ